MVAIYYYSKDALTFQSLFSAFCLRNPELEIKRTPAFDVMSCWPASEGYFVVCYTSVDDASFKMRLSAFLSSVRFRFTYYPTVCHFK